MSDQVTGVEADIVAYIAAGMPYLRSCEDIGDPRSAFELEEIIAPAIRVMFSGDSANTPLNVGASRQVTRYKWNIFMIASSFGPSIEGRHDQTASGGAVEKGIYTMRADLSAALRGKVLQSQAPFVSKPYRVGGEVWTIGESAVVFVDRWYCDVIETGT